MVFRKFTLILLCFPAGRGGIPDDFRFGGDIGVMSIFPFAPFFVGEPVREKIFTAEFVCNGVKMEDGFTGTDGGINDGFGFGIGAAGRTDEKNEVGIVFAEIAESPGDIRFIITADTEAVVAPFGDMEEFFIFPFGTAVVVAFAGENVDEVGIFVVVFEPDEGFADPDLGEVAQSDGEGAGIGVDFEKADAEMLMENRFFL